MGKGVVNLAVIRNKEILVVRGKGNWNLPGGRMDDGKNHLEALAEHLQKELPETRFEIGKLYGEFSSEEPNAKIGVVYYVYLGKIVGDLIQPPVVQAKFVSIVNPKTFTYATKGIISSLRGRGYL